jgi:uncharacterized membrane protein
MRKRWFGLAVLAASVVFSLVTYGLLPETVPMHWNVQGQVDGYGPRWQLVVLSPGLIALMWVLLLLLPRIDPLRESYKRFEGTYYLVINALIVFMGLVHVIAIGAALGWPISIPGAIGAATGVMFMILGNEMGRFQPNWFMGIRTPWTLADPGVWRRTHRVGGRVFVLTGLALVVSQLLLPLEVSYIVLMIIIAIIAIGLPAYSYWLWRRRVQAT